MSMEPSCIPKGLSFGAQSPRRTYYSGIMVFGPLGEYNVPRTLFDVLRPSCTQKLQHPLIKEYTLNYSRDPYMI